MGRWLRREEITDKAVSTGFVGGGGHAAGMAETSGFPAWLVPHEFAVWDLTFLALDALRVGCAEEAATGMVAAACWVQGWLGAPVTGEPGGNGPDPDVVDVSRVEAESWAAGLAGDPTGGLDMTEVCRVLNVPLRIPRRLPQDYAVGVYVALRWMLGMEPEPPMPLPWRTNDGRLASAPHIYTQLLKQRLAATGPVDEPAQARLRSQAMRLAEESRQLVKVVRAQQRRTEQD